MKKNFETITLEIVTFYEEDVIRTSSADNVEDIIDFPDNPENFN